MCISRTSHWLSFFRWLGFATGRCRGNERQFDALMRFSRAVEWRTSLIWLLAAHLALATGCEVAFAGILQEYLLWITGRMLPIDEALLVFKHTGRITPLLVDGMWIVDVVGTACFEFTWVTSW